MHFSQSAGFGFASLGLLLCSRVAPAQVPGNLISPSGWALQDGGASQNLHAYVQNGGLYFSNSGVFGTINGNPGIIVPDFKQTITTTPGQDYVYQFDVNADGAGDNRLIFSVADAGNQVIPLQIFTIPQESGVHYSFTEAATAATTFVYFAGGAPNSVLFVTNISAAPAVPEASTVATLSLLLILGLISLVVTRRKSVIRA